MPNKSERDAFAAYRRMGGRSLNMSEFVDAYRRQGGGSPADVMTSAERMAR